MNPASHREVCRQPLRARLRRETTAAILAAAEEIFAAQGLHAARMEDIAASAGVSVGTLYNYFEDRQTLVCALLGARQDDLLGKLDASLARGSSEPFSAQLEGFLRALFEHFEAHRRFFAILLEGEHAHDAQAFPAARVKPRQTMREVYQRVEKLVRRGLKAKALRDAGADLYPALLMGMVRGVLVRTLLYDKAATALTVRVGELVGFFLKGAGR